MPLLTLRVKMIHRKLFWVFLAGENTVSPCFQFTVYKGSEESSNVTFPEATACQLARCLNQCS